jgi:hypothetical protein
MGNGDLSRKYRQLREVDRSTPSTVYFKNEWSYTATPPIRLHGADRDSFTFFSVYYTYHIEGVRGHVFFTELLIRVIAVWSLSQLPYILYYVSVT